MTSQQVSEKSIFFATIEIESPSDRVVYLDEVCRGNGHLRAEVEGLLAAHERKESLLDAPAIVNAAAEGAAIEGPGTLIGRYKLLELIGEGGFGDVYMAEQQEPVRRKVALKIIKLGMDTRAVIARFEAERQALALMDHPNIAKVLDAGATETGRPYFVMDLVRGWPITEYCDANDLTAQDRLRLFIDVCDAVQHAHQKGIIHRDIKPTNVLVTLRDTKPVPKIIDFGIAKATQQRLTEKTLFTEHRQLVGTPEYMSPEQATFGEADVDTRSDIYSLGVLLYELLVGTTPFDADALRGHGYDEICRVIRESEPTAPSKRLSTLGEVATDISKHRHVEPAALRKLLRGDLDWVVMKCLEKDRTRRYETVNGLAQDIERHLSDEPVHARPPSTRYRLMKYVRKHRVAAAVAVAVVASLALGLVGTTVGLVRANAERQTALRERARAVRERTEAQKQRDRAIAAVQLARGQTDDLLYQAADYRIYASDNSQEELTFRPVPLLEWDCGSDVGELDGQVGSAFVWLRGNRPTVIGAIFRSEWDGALVNWHELRSVAQGPLIADYRGLQVWTPAQAGIEFTPFQGVVPPAETIESRLSQMRDLARQFTASNKTGQGWSSLRLKLEPLYRYGSPGTDLIDGALFAFLDFTDPEVVLLIEARRTGSTARWHYSLAELSWRPLKVHYQGRPILENLAPDLPGWSNILEVGDYRSRSFLNYAPATIPEIRKGESLQKLAVDYEQHSLTLWESAEPQAAQEAAAEARKLWQQLEREFGPNLSVRLHQVQTYSQHAKTHRRAGRSGEAEQAAARLVKLCAQLASDFSDDYRHRERLGFAYAVLGQWDQAAQAYLQAAQLAVDPAERCLSYCKVAKAQAADDHLQAYRATCKKLFAQYGNTEEPKIARYLSNICLWIPQAVSDPHRIVELVELASSEAQSMQDDVSLAIALYRAGHYQEAADRLERELTKLKLDNKNPDNEAAFRAIAWIVLPMAHHQLGDARRARRELHKALEWIDQTHPDHAEKPVAWIDRLLWNERWVLNALRREAEELLSVTSENAEKE